MTFQARQRVLCRYAAGDRKEIGTLVKRQEAHGLTGWWLVRFEDRSAASVHEEMMQRTNA